MDLATIFGIIFGIAMIVVPIFTGGDAGSFYDGQSILITLGGGLASTMISYRLPEMLSIFKVTVKAFKNQKDDMAQLIRMMVEFSNKSRREGLLSLEAELDNIKDDFIKQAIMLVIDGVDPEVIKDTMELELDCTVERHERGQSLYRTMASLFPAWGMIGTLIGLVILLQNLNDPSSIGPAMAVAIITTFYGSVLANLVCTPIANKLAIKSKEEINQKMMIIEGVLSLQSGESPKIIEHKLKGFLSPEQKMKYSKEQNKENASE